MSFSLLVTQREVLERYQHSQVRNEQMRKDAANLTAIFVPISLDRLELLKVCSIGTELMPDVLIVL